MLFFRYPGSRIHDERLSLRVSSGPLFCLDGVQVYRRDPVTTLPREDDSVRRGTTPVTSRSSRTRGRSGTMVPFLGAHTVWTRDTRHGPIPSFLLTPQVKVFPTVSRCTGYPDCNSLERSNVLCDSRSDIILERTKYLYPLTKFIKFVVHPGYFVTHRRLRLPVPQVRGSHESELHFGNSTVATPRSHTPSLLSVRFFEIRKVSPTWYSLCLTPLRDEKEQRHGR